MADSATATHLHRLLDAVSDVDPRELIHCNLCQHPISAAQFRVRINGEFQHRFTNPSQQIFDVSCFQQAPGIAIGGEPTTFYSWFHGFSWQFGHCEYCGEHLGWYYESPDPAGAGARQSFYALISAKLHGAL